MPLSTANVRDYLLRTLGIEDSATASASVLADVLAALNYGLQTLWSAGPDFFSRSSVDVTLVDGTDVYELADGVQSVLGPLRMPDGRTLRALDSRGELDNFGLIYLGQTEADVADGTPLAYFIETIYQAIASGGSPNTDPVRVRLHIVPAPNAGAAGAAVLDGVLEVPRVELASLSGSDLLPVASQYLETLFLPLCRKHVSSSVYFSAVQLQEKIDEEYERALIALGRTGESLSPPKEVQK